MSEKENKENQVKETAETKKEENTTTITSNTNKNDTTIANKVLPNTGYIPVIIFLIISFAIVGMFVYIRYKNIDK